MSWQLNYGFDIENDSKSNENKYPIQYYWLLHKPCLTGGAYKQKYIH
jgi:hypothetical protein